MTAARPELQVDLDALAANWRLIRDAVAPSAAGAVVKADGYGLGAIPIAVRLFGEGCRDFFVATADEALTLRPHIPIAARVHVFEGPQLGTAAQLAAVDVIPVLNSAPQLACWRAAAVACRRTLPASVHVDTGMSRLGFDVDTLARLAQDSDGFAGIDLHLLMTHLACADTPADPHNAGQLVRFEVARRLLPRLRTSIGNSAGALAGVSTRGELVRPGIALYGSNPLVDVRAVALREVARVRAPILQVRAVRQGETIGYGATFAVSRASRVAIVALGYADGYLRALSNCGWGVLDGQRVPLVGRVSMDLTTFDVTDVKSNLAPGAMITVLGDGVDVDALAQAAGTLSYEVLTRLGPRLKRRYLGMRN